MAIRLSGMNSGLDTDSIVTALVSGYKTKKEKYEKAQTKLQWKQDAWKSLNTKVYSLYSNISSLRFSSAYSLKKTTVSDSTKATVTAASGAPNGTQSLQIKETAKAGYLTGAEIKASSDKTTLAELGYNGGDAKINVANGKGDTSTITLSATSTVADVVKQLKTAGLEANYDSTYKRLYISSKDTGVENDFTITGANTNGADALYKLGIAYKGAASTYSNYESYHGNTDAETQSNIQAAVDKYNQLTNDAAKANQQSSNALKAITYGTAYADMMDFYKKNNIDNTELFSTLAGLGSKRDSALITANDDETYDTYFKSTVTDTEGNAVYSDGKGNYISAQERYTIGDVTYKKNSDGKYVTDDENEKEYEGDTAELLKNKTVTYFKTSEKVTYKGSDDKIYTKVEEKGNTDSSVEKYADEQGNIYVKNAKDGKFYKQDADGNIAEGTEGIEIKANYSYEPGVAVTAQNAAETYTDLTKSFNETDEGKAELAKYESDLSTVNIFESTDDSKVLSEDDAYTIKKLTSAIHDAYALGENDSSSTGLDYVKTLIAGNGDETTGFAAKVADYANAADEANSNLKAYETVKDLASIKDQTSDKYKKALADFTEKVNTAHSITKNGAKYNDNINKVDGSDAKIVLNNVEYTGSSNTFNINNLTITALAKTSGDDEVSITTSTDTQGIYDKIKDFLTEYNNIINEMTKLYNAESAGSYEPLTDDEKEEMSDSEIEKWETKIKDSLLKNDTTLSGVMSAMQNAMSSAIEINGKKYSFSSFGIHTLGYLNAADNEQNAYHIDGDEDDTNTSGNSDKLMTAIANDPDTVMSFMQQMASKLYTAIGDKMSSSTLSSAFTIYNDKQMQTEYNNYTTLIKQWETKLSDKEEYYYNKFSNMETALAKLNSTQSSLSGYFS